MSLATRASGTHGQSLAQSDVQHRRKLWVDFDPVLRECRRPAGTLDRRSDRSRKACPSHDDLLGLPVVFERKLYCD